MCSLMDIVDQFENDGYGGFEENKTSLAQLEHGVQIKLYRRLSKAQSVYLESHFLSFKE